VSVTLVRLGSSQPGPRTSLTPVSSNIDTTGPEHHGSAGPQGAGESKTAPVAAVASDAPVLPSSSGDDLVELADCQREMAEIDSLLDSLESALSDEARR